MDDRSSSDFSMEADLSKPARSPSARPAPHRECARPAAAERYLGIDAGAETIKVVELVREGGVLRPGRRIIAEHGKDPGRVLVEVLRGLEWESARSAAASGRLSRNLKLPRVPTKQAQARGFRHLRGAEPATVVSIGSHGFSVLELRETGNDVYRENSRCSQGTGNFLRQLVERFSLSIEEASELAAGVREPAPLSGRCPVILKTDMTHLANKGEDRARILAGLFDAVCENVQVLIKPGATPRRVTIVGGVSRSERVRAVFGRWLERNGMVLESLDIEDAIFIEALGCALEAADRPVPVPPLERLLAPPRRTELERVPPLSSFLGLVHRMERRPLLAVNGTALDLILGLDIGSTGSKCVAIEASGGEAVWEGYLNTGGDPIGAAQYLFRKFLEGPAGRCRVIAIGVTGSGREIVGSLLATCYGRDAVFILNEIAAHAAGALHHDPKVDTIFEIGGQDAKFIRLAGGRVVDCAMNEACSAGTGSFIEEQGRKFAGVRDVVGLGREAIAAPSGVSLGQHCSVFMAEVIDEAVAAGVEQRSIIAGLYDSVIQNYLNRVKGSRPVGEVIFCQGMPFSSDALAAAVARQTGSRIVIPPNPGTVGSLGIALLARRELERKGGEPIDPRRFLAARIEKKDTFRCKATTGCGGPGNLCRIDRIVTIVEGERGRFSWGGACALHDKGGRKRKLPDLSPDPFREREALARRAVEPFLVPRGGRKAAITDQFVLKGLFPYFAALLHELGFDIIVPPEAGQDILKRGIGESNVPYCAPLQLNHGLVSRMMEEPADIVFLPMVRTLPRGAGEKSSVTCPIAQASTELIAWDLRDGARDRIVSPVIDFGMEGFESAAFLRSLRRMARTLGAGRRQIRLAHEKAWEVQRRFEEDCFEIGRRALTFCAEGGIPPVVVLGRPYTIYNTVLNSNVPAILREQGAVPIPIDCYPVGRDVPIFPEMYWGYGQKILRAAHQIRRTPGVWSIYSSNYSCGPDSFNLHIYAYAMEGKPFAIIETDGHSGDAGTKTRIEAFLHCVEEDRKASAERPRRDLRDVGLPETGFEAARKSGAKVLIPGLGSGSEVVATCLNAIGVPTETLPKLGTEAIRLGRRHTSGKECLPMAVTLGSLIQRLEAETDEAARFILLMPRCQGPCRFGIYNVLNRIVLERLGRKDRVDIWSPNETGYFVGTPPAFAMLVFTGFVTNDLLLAGLHDARPFETRRGAAGEIHERYVRELHDLLTREMRKPRTVLQALWEATGGRLFGAAELLRRASLEYAAVRRPVEAPTVLVVGEIYVRCNPFTNDWIVEKLEERGLRARLAPFNEVMEYFDVCNIQERRWRDASDLLSIAVQQRVRAVAHAAMAPGLGWPQRTKARQAVKAAAPYMRKELLGEAVMTIGTPVLEWREGLIDAAVSVGPLECMPNKIAEAQLFHAAEQEDLLSLTLSLNGDPIDPEVLDNFAFEVHARFRRRKGTTGGGPTDGADRTPGRKEAEREAPRGHHRKGRRKVRLPGMIVPILGKKSAEDS